MCREIKYELYKLFRECFLWGTLLIILIISFVMTSGSNITLNNLLQKSFLTEIIASLYAAFFIARDLEDKRILYPILSGNNRFKIIICQFVSAVIATEILNLAFPLFEIFQQSEWLPIDKLHIILNYIILGVFLASLGLLMAWVFKKSGMAIVGGIIFHIISLFLMNHEILSTAAMRFFPVGVTKLLIEGNATGYIYMIPWIWTAVLLLFTVLISRNRNL